MLELDVHGCLGAESCEVENGLESRDALLYRSFLVFGNHQSRRELHSFLSEKR